MFVLRIFTNEVLQSSVWISIFPQLVYLSQLGSFPWVGRMASDKIQAQINCLLILNLWVGTQGIALERPEECRKIDETGVPTNKILKQHQGPMVTVHTNDLIHNMKECEFIEDPDFYQLNMGRSCRCTPSKAIHLKGR